VEEDLSSHRMTLRKKRGY